MTNVKSYVPAWSDVTSNPFSYASATNNQLIKYNSTTGKWENWTPTFLMSFTETDPVRTSVSSNYYTKSNIQTSGSAQVHFGNLTNKPTTLAGYGIIDAFNGTWAGLTGRPTTLAGYGITDAMSTSHSANAITAKNISNWSTAYGWGNHAGLYRPLSYVPAWSEITSNPFSFVSASNNQLIKFNSVTGKWENWTPNYLTSYSETDPAFIGWNKSSGITISSSQISDFQSSVTSNSAVLANTAKISYPSTDATKLAGIAIGAEVNVNADWNAVSGDAQIVNKPSLSTVAVTGNFSDLLMKPTTIAGYGITDAVKTSGDQTIAGNKSFSGTTTVATPVNPTDAANKAYVDALIAQIEELQLQTGIKIKDVDGNIYNTVKIGAQVWMKENLKTTKYSDGTPIADGSNVANIGYTDKYYFYLSDLNYKENYGLLYSWAGATNGVSSSINPTTVQGACPDGWHMPSNNEWIQLITYLGGESVAGGKLKETGTTFWKSPNLGATNESGFSARAGGLFFYQLAYRNLAGYATGGPAVFWTATENTNHVDLSTAFDYSLDYNYTVTSPFNHTENKGDGFSVRCVKNN